MSVTYPFVPKSTAYLEVGQFWNIPMKNGLFACGMVLQTRRSNRRTFIAGLMDWSGEHLPEPSDLPNCKILEHGQLHVKAISDCNGKILGCQPIEETNLQVPLSLDQGPSPNCRLRRGFDVLGLASTEQMNVLPVFSTWGYNTMYIRAEKYFGNSA